MYYFLSFSFSYSVLEGFSVRNLTKLNKKIKGHNGFGCIATSITLSNIKQEAFFKV